MNERARDQSVRRRSLQTVRLIHFIRMPSVDHESIHPCWSNDWGRLNGVIAPFPSLDGIINRCSTQSSDSPETRFPRFRKRVCTTCKAGGFVRATVRQKRHITGASNTRWKQERL